MEWDRTLPGHRNEPRPQGLPTEVLWTVADGHSTALENQGDGLPTDEDPVDLIGNDVAVPQATYKVIGWFDDDGEFQARGYVVRQEDRVRNNPAHYLRSIVAAVGMLLPDAEAPWAGN